MYTSEGALRHGTAVRRGASRRPHLGVARVWGHVDEGLAGAGAAAA